jgi:hypothetical protein
MSLNSFRKDQHGPDGDMERAYTIGLIGVAVPNTAEFLLDGAVLLVTCPQLSRGHVRELLRGSTGISTRPAGCVPGERRDPSST